jgi:hypothetical protein
MAFSSPCPPAYVRQGGGLASEVNDPDSTAEPVIHYRPNGHWSVTVGPEYIMSWRFASLLGNKGWPNDYRANDHLEYAYGSIGQWTLGVFWWTASLLSHIHGSHRSAWKA